MCRLIFVLVFSGAIFAQSTSHTFIAIPSGANTGTLRFEETLTNGQNYVGFRAPTSIGADLIWTLPAADGSSGDALVTDGTGGLSFSASVSPPFPNNTVIGQTEAAQGTWYYDTYSSGASFHRSLVGLQRARGTASAPLAVNDGDSIGGIYARRYDGATWAANTLLNSNYSSSVGGRYQFYVYDTGGVASVELLIDKDSAVFGGIVNPNVSLTHDVGKSTHRWKDYYGKTINLTGGIGQGWFGVSAYSSDPTTPGYLETQKLSLFDHNAGGAFGWDMRAEVLIDTNSNFILRDNTGDTILSIFTYFSGAQDKLAYFDGDWLPEGTLAHGLGRASNRWLKQWVQDIDISGNMVPETDNGSTLGEVAKRFQQGYFNNVTVDNVAAVGMLRLKFGTNYINHQSPQSGSWGSTIYTWPATPTADYFLKTDGIGTLSWAQASAPPFAASTVLGQVEGDFGLWYFDAYSSATAGDSTLIAMRRARGTAASPAAVADGDDIGYLIGYRHNGTGWEINSWIHMNYGSTNGGEFNFTVYDASGVAFTPLTLDKTGATVDNLTINGTCTGCDSLPHPNGSIITKADGAADVKIKSWTNSGLAAAQVQFYKARGTEAAPATIVSGDEIGRLSAYGRDSSGTDRVAAQIKMIARTVGATSVDGSVHLLPSQSGSSTTALIAWPDGSVGINYGSDPTQQFYVNGVSRFSGTVEMGGDTAPDTRDNRGIGSVTLPFDHVSGNKIEIVDVGSAIKWDFRLNYVLASTNIMTLYDSAGSTAVTFERQVLGSTTNQARVDFSWSPNSDNNRDLGSTTYSWRNVSMDGSLFVGGTTTIDASRNGSFANLTASGTGTFSGATTLASSTGNVTLGSGAGWDVVIKSIWVLPDTSGVTNIGSNGYRFNKFWGDTIDLGNTYATCISGMYAILAVTSTVLQICSNGTLKTIAFD